MKRVEGTEWRSYDDASPIGTENPFTITVFSKSGFLETVQAKQAGFSCGENKHDFECVYEHDAYAIDERRIRVVHCEKVDGVLLPSLCVGLPLPLALASFFPSFVTQPERQPVMKSRHTEWILRSEKTLMISRICGAGQVSPSLRVQGYFDLPERGQCR